MGPTPHWLVQRRRAECLPWQVREHRSGSARPGRGRARCVPRSWASWRLLSPGFFLERKAKENTACLLTGQGP